MKVVLSGNWPSTLTAGILLLSRARSFGIPVQVEILGNEATIEPVSGPVVVHAHVLASCGVGRDLGAGALVVVPGPAVEPVLVCLEPNGSGTWFEVDSRGAGVHPATQAFVRLARDQRPEARHASRLLRRFLSSLGVPAEPAVLDVLFGAPCPPLTRLALALRAGRAMTEEPGREITHWLVGGSVHLQVMPPTGAELLEAWEEGGLETQLEHLRIGARISVEDFLEAMHQLSEAGQDGFHELLGGFGEIAEHLLVLPEQGILPPLDATIDAVAAGLARVLGAPAVGKDANRSMAETFRFLGGRFTDYSGYTMELENEPAPEGRVERWCWFLSAVASAADDAERLWKNLTDPVS